MAETGRFLGAFDSGNVRCTCKDHEYRGVRCKHLRRVAFATGEESIPTGVDGVDPQLGEHVDGESQVVATDGGTDVIEAGDESDESDTSPVEEVLPNTWLVEEESDDGRPDDHPVSNPALGSYLPSVSRWKVTVIGPCLCSPRRRSRPRSPGA